MKIIMSPEMEKNIVAMGMTVNTARVIGVIELLSIILFLIPRTGVLGTLLLTAYVGGAICTHVLKGLPLYTPVLVEAVIWIAALIRFPEIGWRLFGASPDRLR
jgi:hypothetical protein